MFLDQLADANARIVYVVGASDGKFVLPLARRGFQVKAIERDALALDGGPVMLPGPEPGTMPGLRRRLDQEQLSHAVDVIQADLLETDDLPPGDAVWTSCSWHYSTNHHRPLSEFIGKMAALCPDPGGLFGAEFMMPVLPGHFDIEHYLEAGAIRRYLTGWRILWETYTPPFVEAAHVEQLSDHIHRMGLVIAQRPSYVGMGI